VFIDPKCRHCEVYGYCTGTEEECEAYQEFLSWREQENSPAVDCQTCEINQKSSSINTANRGLINRLTGSIVEVVEGDIMAQVTIKTGDNYITSITPRDAFIASGKKIGDIITVAIKSFNVKMMK